MNWKKLAGLKLNERHILGTFLGFGAYGYVYELHDARHVGDSNLAIKLVPAFGKEEILFQLAREGFYGVVLDHPRLMRLHEFERDTLTHGGESCAYYYHVMDRASASLDQVAPSLDAMEKVEIAGAVIEATHYLHTVAKKRHGDIKPQNILRFGKIWKLSDFGLIRDTSKGTKKTGRIMGTIGWLEPNAVASGSLTTSSDMYACGILIFYLLRNRLPEDVNEISSEIKRSSTTEQPLMQLASSLVIEREKRLSSGDALVAIRDCGYTPLLGGDSNFVVPLTIGRPASLIKGSGITIYGRVYDEAEIFAVVGPAMHGVPVSSVNSAIFQSLLQILPEEVALDCEKNHKFSHQIGSPLLTSWFGTWCVKGWCEFIDDEYSPKLVKLTNAGMKIIRERLP